MKIELATAVAGTYRDRAPQARLRLGVGLALLVGEAPNAATVGKPYAWLAPDGTKRRHAGNRLGGWTGLRVNRFRALFDRTNVFETPPVGWPIAAARARAELLHRQLAREPRPTVFLGRRVCDAFGLTGPAFPGWYGWQIRLRKDLAPEVPETEQLAAPCGSHGRELSVSDLELARRYRAVYVAAAPHPSTRSRLWNDRAAVQRASAFWRKLAVLLEVWSDILREQELPID